MSHRAIVLVLSAMVLLGRNGQAQTYTCFSATSDQTAGLRAEIVSLVTGTAPQVVATRDTLKLLPASASQVSIVTQTSKCKSAAQAYHAALIPGSPQISRSMVVIKIGNSRYVITDPAERQGEFGTVMITDGSFNVLAMMTS